MEVLAIAARHNGFLALCAQALAQRLVPIVSPTIFNCSHPPKVERALRYLELTHGGAPQLAFRQELRLVVLHERQQPIAALLPLFGKFVREFLASALGLHVHNCNLMTIGSEACSGNSGFIDPFGLPLNCERTVTAAPAANMRSRDRENVQPRPVAIQAPLSYTFRGWLAALNEPQRRPAALPSTVNTTWVLVKKQ